jgi:hypothetical protein
MFICEMGTQDTEPSSNPTLPPAAPMTADEAPLAATFE